jgi:hypothetical protein
MAVISNLQAGIALNTTGNLYKAGEVTISDPAGFFPLYNANGVLQSGGVYLTMYVGAGMPGTSSMLIAGQAINLKITYNSKGQFRYDVVPFGGTTLSSDYYPVNSEHSLGVSYDTTTGLTILSVDGVSQSATLKYTVSGTSPLVVGQNFGSSLLSSPSNPSTFNGYLDQMALFDMSPTASALNLMTSDPLAANASFFTVQSTGNPVGHIESQTGEYATTAYLLSGSGNTVKVSTLSGIQIGDILYDATSPGALPNGGSTGDLVSAINSNVVTLFTPLASSVAQGNVGDTLVFYHPSSTMVSVNLVAGQTQFVSQGVGTGIMAGDMVSGFDVPVNATVSSVSADGHVVLSSPVTSITGASSSLTFTHPPVTTNVTATVATAAINSPIQTLSSSVGIQLGDVVFGTGIPPEDHVIAINGSVLTFSAPFTTTITPNPPNPPIPEVLTFVHSTLATSTSFGQYDNGATIISVENTNTIGHIQAGDIIVDNTNLNALLYDTVVNFNPSTGGITLSTPVASTGISPGDYLTFTHTTSTTTTASANTASTTVSLTSVVGVQVGDIVVDITNNPYTVNTGSGLRVTAVTGKTVNLSGSLQSAFSGDTLAFIHPPGVTALAGQGSASAPYTPTLTAGTSMATIGYQLTAGTNLLVNSLAGIQAGDLVFGAGFPVNEKVDPSWVGDITNPAVTLTSPTTILIPPNTPIQFVHPTDPNVQIISLKSTSAHSAAGATSYRTGDTIAITAYLNANTPVTRSYTVTSSNLDVDPLHTEDNIANAFVSANPMIGSYYVINGPFMGTIELVPMNTAAMPLPPARITDTNALGIDVNTVSQYYNFYKITNPNNTFSGADNANVASLTDSTGQHLPTAVSVSYASSTSTTTATKQTHGPVYAELSSVSAGSNIATYNLFIDPTYITAPSLTSVGMTINVPTLQATIKSILAGPGGTISQVNDTNAAGGVITYQWLSNLGVTDYTKPIAQLQLTLSTGSVNAVNATMTNLSVNSTNYKDPVQNIPMLQASDLNSQAYSLTGHFYQQYNPATLTGLPFGNTTAGAPYNRSFTQVPIPAQDFSYTVSGYGSSNLIFSVQNNKLTAPTPANPSAVVNLDLIAQNMSPTASKMPFAVTLDVPSNSSNVFFTAGTGVTLTSSTATVGHTLTLTGTYTAPTGKGVVATTTPILGTLQATLSNEFNNGSQFSMDTVSINGVAGTGQSLYFGMGESDATGAYSINNVPAGLLTVTPINNVAAINPRNITVNDALAVLSIAAGKGIQSGLGEPLGSASNLLPSDFIAADFNGDGQVTAADALSILNYIVAVVKVNLTPSFTYFPATSDSTLFTYMPSGVPANTPPSSESVTAVVLPANTPIMTDKNGTTVLSTGDGTKIIDIIGVLPGDVVNY